LISQLTGRHSDLTPGARSIASKRLMRMPRPSPQLPGLHVFCLVSQPTPYGTGRPIKLDLVFSADCRIPSSRPFGTLLRGAGGRNRTSIDGNAPTKMERPITNTTGAPGEPLGRSGRGRREGLCTPIRAPFQRADPGSAVPFRAQSRLIVISTRYRRYDWSTNENSLW
jgi:hypothetical protein